MFKYKLILRHNVTKEVMIHEFLADGMLDAQAYAVHNFSLNYRLLDVQCSGEAAPAPLAPVLPLPSFPTVDNVVSLPTCPGKRRPDQPVYVNNVIKVDFTAKARVSA